MARAHANVKRLFEAEAGQEETAVTEGLLRRGALLAAKAGVVMALSVALWLQLREGYEWARARVDREYQAALVGLTADRPIDELIDEAARRWNVKAALVHAVAEVESGKSPTSYSLAGAIGILQVMPGNAKRCGLKHPGKLWDEATNIDCGTRILAEEMDRFKGDVEKVLAVYNCGRADCPAGRQYAQKVLVVAGRRLL
jgi:soluble lytic murein transglycosylase-like protein